MTLEDIEQQIYEHYQHFHKEAPGVQALETGTLYYLWRAFDNLVNA